MLSYLHLRCDKWAVLYTLQETFSNHLQTAEKFI